MSIPATGFEPERFFSGRAPTDGLNSFVFSGGPGRSSSARKWSYSMRTFALSTGEGKTMSDQITMRKFRESDGVEDWRVVGEGACAYFRTGSFAVGAGLVKAICELADPDQQQPDVEQLADVVL